MYVSKPTILKSTCLVNVKYFPFDVQACKMKFGSWTYHSLQLNLTKQSQEPVLKGFMKNEQWNLELALTRQHVVKYGTCPSCMLAAHSGLSLNSSVCCDWTVAASPVATCLRP